MATAGTRLTMGHMFAHNARYLADEPAATYGDVTLTHGELYRSGCRLAAGLEALGMKKQDRVAVLSMNNMEYLQVYVAGWTAGFVVATVNFRLALPEILWILNDISPTVLIVESRYADMLPQIRKEVGTIEQVVMIGGSAPDTHAFEDVIANAPADMPGIVAEQEDVLALIYTSGTTGRPKGCILGQREMAIMMQAVTQVMGFLPGDRFLCVMPMFHIGAIGVGFTGLTRGGTLIIHHEFEPEEVARSLEEDAITQSLLAPTMVQMVLDGSSIAERDLSALRTICYSAAPMPTPVLRRAMEVFGPVFMQILGSSEGTFITEFPKSLHRPDGSEKDRQRLLSTGFPAPNVRIRTVDEDGNDCAVNEPGEVLIKSPMIFRGYWSNSPATLAAVRDGWYYSGDIGRFDEDGFLYLVDRKKDMIISGGENIYSREVEEALLQHPAVSEVAVVGRPDETWGETVCAVVVLGRGKSASEEELIAHSLSLIASYKKPRNVIFVNELPKLVSGKIDKKALRSRHC